MADVSTVTGPLAPFAAGFVDDLSRQGFKPETVGRHVALLAGLSTWLAAEGAASSGLSSEVAERYAAARRAAGHMTSDLEKLMANLSDSERDRLKGAFAADPELAHGLSTMLADLPPDTQAQLMRRLAALPTRRSMRMLHALARRPTQS